MSVGTIGALAMAEGTLAGMFDFAPAGLLEVTDPAVREAPKISFD